MTAWHSRTKMKKVHLIPILGTLIILLIVLIILTSDFKSVATVEVIREENRVVKFERVPNEEFEEALRKEDDSASEIIEDVQKKFE